MTNSKREVPKVFDWVKARSECSLRTVFLQLFEVADSDVQAIQALVKDAKFSINKTSEDKFIVARTWNDGGREVGKSIVFKLTRNGISVKPGGSDDHLFIARAAIVPTGECKLEIEGEPEALELWQVSRKALEKLFFPEP